MTQVLLCVLCRKPLSPRATGLKLLKTNHRTSSCHWMSCNRSGTLCCRLSTVKVSALIVKEGKNGILQLGMGTGEKTLKKLGTSSPYILKSLLCLQMRSPHPKWQQKTYPSDIGLSEETVMSSPRQLPCKTMLIFPRTHLNHSSLVREFQLGFSSGRPLKMSYDV